MVIQEQKRVPKTKGMKLKLEKLPTIAALLGVPIGFLFGAWTPLMAALLVFIALDLVTGFMKGIYKKELRSRKMLQGGIHKMSIFIMVIVANMMDMAMFAGVPVVKGAVITYYMAMEGLSILENLGAMNFPIPAFIKENLELLKNKGSKIDVLKEVDAIIVKKDEEVIELETKPKE